MRNAALLIFLGLAGLFATSCSQHQSDSNELVVGMELAYPPFEMTDPNNQPTGVSVDLALALGEFLDRPVRIENIPFAGLIPSLKTGKIDLIISSMTATEERAKSIDFSDPYLSTGLCLLASRKSSGNNIEDFDKKGSKLAVKQGTTGHIYTTESIQNADILVFEKEAAAVVEVAQGKVDAFIYDQMSTYMNWQRHPETTRPILRPFKTESWAIGLNKGNEELRSQVNAFLSDFRGKGGFENLGDKYLGEQKKAFAELGYPFFF